MRYERKSRGTERALPALHDAITGSESVDTGAIYKNDTRHQHCLGHWKTTSLNIQGAHIRQLGA